MVATILSWACVIMLAWLPIDFGIQALHQYNAGKKLTCGAMLLVALIINVLVIISIGPLP